MLTKRLAMYVGLVYSLIAGASLLMDTYTRIFKRGNSEMAGLATYLFTFPASVLLDWLSKQVGLATIGESDTWFVVILGGSVLINAVLVYCLVAGLTVFLRRRT